MKIGPWPQKIPLGKPQETGAGQPDKSGDSSSRRDRLEISHQTRAKLAALADQARGVESVATNGNRLGKATYDKRDIERAAGEAFAGGLTGAQPDDSRESAKIDRVRCRIQSGFYDRPQVKREIARKLLDEIARPPDGESRSLRKHGHDIYSNR